MNQPMTIKHFYYSEEYTDRHGRVRTACNIYVDKKTETDCLNPTCEICKKEHQTYESLRLD